MTMITPSYLGETIEYSSLHACRSTLEDPTNLGWGPAITTQFQIDGSDYGTTWGNVYLDQLTVSRW